MKRMTISKRIDIIQRTGHDPVKSFRAAKFAHTKRIKRERGHTTRTIVVRGRQIVVETLR